MSVTVMVLMGSASDWEVMREVGVELGKLGIPSESRVTSAHRSLDRTVELVRAAERDGVKVFVCGAGMAAHLGGVVAAATTRPVIGVPLAGGVADGLDALLATVQMPGGIPVATVAVGKAGARNAAFLAAQMLALADPVLADKVLQARAAAAAAVEEADAALPRGGGRA